MMNVNRRLNTDAIIWSYKRRAWGESGMDSLGDIADRLRRLRVAVGYDRSAAAFAQTVDITPQAWNNYEKGRRRIELDQAMKLVRRYGVSLDWIYRGEPWMLRPELQEKLTPSPPPPRASGKRR